MPKTPKTDKANMTTDNSFLRGEIIFHELVSHMNRLTFDSSQLAFSAVVLQILFACEVHK